MSWWIYIIGQLTINRFYRIIKIVEKYLLSFQYRSLKIMAKTKYHTAVHYQKLILPCAVIWAIFLLLNSIFVNFTWHVDVLMVFCLPEIHIETLQWWPIFYLRNLDSIVIGFHHFIALMSTTKYSREIR